MNRTFASVTTAAEPTVRHYQGLPDSASRRELPLPTVAVLEETPEGFYLIRLDGDGGFCGDTWHLTAEDARGQAGFEFDRVGSWREIPAEVSDPIAYAVLHAEPV